MKKSILMRFRSIRTSIIFSFTLLIVFSLMVFLLLSLRFTRETVLENSTEYTSQLIGQVNNDIDSYIDHMENISFIVAGNSDVRDYLFLQELSQERELELRDRIAGVFKTITDTRSDIANIGLLPRNRECLINRGSAKLNPFIEVSELSWYQEAVAAGGNTVVSSSHVQNAIYGSYDWVVTLSCNIAGGERQETGGVFFVDLNYSAISDLCERLSLGNRGYIYILDRNGGIVYHPQQQLIYSGMKQELISEVMEAKESSFLTEDGRLYTISRSEQTGWIVVGVSLVSELMRRADEARKIYLLIALALFMAALALAYLLSDEITKPVKSLEKSMKEVEKGNFAPAVMEVREENEIGHLRRNFNMMTEEIRKLMEQRDQEQQTKRKSELKALQAQINPHFLYNTLDSLYWKATESGNDEIAEDILSLSQLFRLVLNRGNGIVTVQTEADLLERYLHIQKMRFGRRLEYEISLDKSILEEEIPKLILQPFVENAIVHGFEKTDGSYTLSITETKEEKHMIFQIRDTGVGMSDEQMRAIWEHADTRKYASQRIGRYAIKNVMERLELIYHENHELHIESRMGQGTTVTISVPCGLKEIRQHEYQIIDCG